jgi:beta-phosphoglucomutase-like phosphatase (HAD superfamily)
MFRPGPIILDCDGVLLDSEVCIDCAAPLSVSPKALTHFSLLSEGDLVIAADPRRIVELSKTL